MIPVEIHGVAVDDSQKNFFILLKEKNGTNRWIPVPTSPREAREIAVALHENAGSPRPLTHDLLTTFIDKLGAKVVEVSLFGSPKQNILSFVHLETREGEHKKIEATPADALAIAVRSGALISAEDQTLIEMDDKMFEEDKKVQENSAVEKLKKQLATAVESEDYEKAVELRGKVQDQIRLQIEATELPDDINEELRRAYYGDKEKPLDDSN